MTACGKVIGFGIMISVLGNGQFNNFWGIIMNLNFLKALAVTSTIIAAMIFSFDAHTRGFQRAVSNTKGNSVQSNGTAKTKFTRGSGVTNSSNRTITGPKNNATYVDHTGNTSYTQDQGVAHTGETTVTGQNGKTVSTSSNGTAEYNETLGVTTNNSTSVTGPQGKVHDVQSQSQTTQSNGVVTTTVGVQR